ncbi:hypothetical protein [Mycobacterium sp. 236(2023)]|uniref:hypothetical protein n=1 Tax=Mycobacterium sp. 236(2023) TaxID=3038163 RepID=UPI0024153B78|nr:hypothetical protein [Mycobacterium sp. 236(2023)]MDG4667005.1 hypothetical protein [Mycobacterium sp. 236(2023)]
MVKKPTCVKIARSRPAGVEWTVTLSAAIAAAIALARVWRRFRPTEVPESKSTTENDTSPEPPATSSPDEPAVTPTATQEPEIDMARISADVERARQLVPTIGARWRWYDIPYRLLDWTLRSSRGRRAPWQFRYRLNNGRNFLSAFNHYERLKVERLDDPRKNLIVPADEKVTQGGIWVVEFFPPSMYSNLRQALEKNGWDAPSPLLDIYGSNADRVTQARRVSQMMWTQIGTVVDPKSRYFAGDAKREALPMEFGSVQLTAVQLGHSLTAITAYVRLSEEGQTSLNKVWKAQHDPTLTWRGLKPPHVESRNFAAIRATQRERKRLHDLARSWLASRCGGYFAATEARQPVMDFNIFANFDPTAASPTREMRDPLRALGMDGDHVYNYISPQLPGGVLTQGNSLRRDDGEDLRNCWGLVASYQVFADHNDEPGYGPKPLSVSALAAMTDEAVRGFLLAFAVVRYTEQHGETLSAARDAAQSKHREFTPRQVDQLREELLTSSLDLPVVARDTAFLWEAETRLFYSIQAEAVPIPGDPYPAEAFDLMDRFAQRCTSAFERLISDDSAYRDVLATASALGSSAASNRLSKRALMISGTSLVVSITAVLTTNDAAAWHQIAEWSVDMWHWAWGFIGGHAPAGSP